MLTVSTGYGCSGGQLKLDFDLLVDGVPDSKSTSVSSPILVSREHSFFGIVKPKDSPSDSQDNSMIGSHISIFIA